MYIADSAIDFSPYSVKLESFNKRNVVLISGERKDGWSKWLYVYRSNETFKYPHLDIRVPGADGGYPVHVWCRKYFSLGYHPPFDWLPTILHPQQPLPILTPQISSLAPTLARCGFRNLRRVISQPFIMQLRGCILRQYRGWCGFGCSGGIRGRLLVQSITMHRVYRPDNQQTPDSTPPTHWHQRSSKWELDFEP